MPPTKDLIKAAIFAFSPFVAAVLFVAMVIGVAKIVDRAAAPTEYDAQLLRDQQLTPIDD